MRLYFLALGTLLIVCVGCAHDGQQLLHKDEYTAPPAQMMAQPGPMVGGPGPGVLNMGPPGGVAQASYMAGEYCPPGYGGGYGAGPQMPKTSQVRFLGPEGMSIGWQIGHGFAENQLMAPDRYNFNQSATYRLKLTNIPGREGLAIYPSLHVYPVHPTTAAYLEHNALPLRINDEDLDQIETNNFVTKVIYLPDSKYQELAIAGVEELVSTRLGPGMDPVTEADRRGTIMAVLRMGNMDLEMHGGPSMGAAGAPQLGRMDENGNIVPVSGITQVDGEEGNFAPPVPVGGYLGVGNGSIPGDMMMGASGGPGQPPYDPILGTSTVQMYGMPRSGTPIGLVGPPHIPLGRPAGLKSHTIRNTSEYDVGEEVDHMLIDVAHEPGIRLPHPVKYMQYTETHPQYQQGELSMPANAGGGAYCPPGQQY